MKKPRDPQKVPEPRQSRKRPSAISRVVLWLFVLFIIGTAGLGALGFFTYQEYTRPGPLADKKVFVVEKGYGTPEIAAALEDGGIIRDARVFSGMAYVTGTRTRLKAGEYEFAAEASMRDVMALIASGKSITYKISIPEGWTSEMAVARVNANEILEGSAATVPAEGAIMPDTYVFRRGMTKQKLVDDMQAAQKSLLDDLWQKRSPVLAIGTKEEAVTLASIVEKETGVADERPVIASLFMNRLKKGMRLQSDPTIIYGIVGGKGKLDRALTRDDIMAETPYNTYRIDGLPPGPIANPGRAALKAVLNPSPTEYLYFVANGSGGHAFSTTLEEHNRNVKKWRQIAGNAAAAAAADTAAADTAANETPTPPAEPAPEPVKPPEMAANGQNPPAAEPPSEVMSPPAGEEPLQAETAAASTETAAPPVETPPAPTEPPKDMAEATPATAEPQRDLPEPPPKPPEKPEQQAAAASSSPPRPGSVIRVDGELVAIPKQNPKR